MCNRRNSSRALAGARLPVPPESRSHACFGASAFGARFKAKTRLRARSAALCVVWTALLAPALAHAHSSLADDQFDCRSDPHTFIASLIDDNSITPKPTRVEADSVNAFRPVKGTRLTAFGMPIYAVFGYAPGDTLFRRGSGKQIDKPLYGVVVRAPAMVVRQRLSEHHSDATIKTVVPLVLTAIVCNASS